MNVRAVDPEDSNLPAPLGDDDVAAIMSSVERFCASSLQTACERPERPATPAQVSALRLEAQEIGLLDTGDQPGFGLWGQVRDATARRLSVRMLVALARVNAGVAFHLHGLALARFAARSLGLAGGPETIVSLHGAWGLGRGALARFLRGAEIDVEESVLLADYFGCDGPRELLVQSGDEWREVILPSFDAAERRLSFGVFSRTSLAAAPQAHGHGLDETTTCVLARGPHVSPLAEVVPEPEQGRELFAQALGLHALGLLAIGVGVLGHAYASAREYAGTRTQGGVKIERHPAVQELLGRAYAVERTAAAAIEGLTLLPPGRASLPRILAARAELHPSLCAGTNDALQVFGGLGYMRDVGLEKLVRDQNCLRLLGGTPSELRRFAAEWERP